MKIIGWGPTHSLRPTIPTTLYVEDESGTVRIWKADQVPPAKVSLDEHVQAGVAERLLAEMSTGEWLCLENDGPVTFPLDQEQEWCRSRAQRVMNELAGDPLKRLALVKAAAELLSIDITGISKHVLSAQKPNETLAQVLARMKPTKL